MKKKILYIVTFCITMLVCNGTIATPAHAETLPTVRSEQTAVILSTPSYIVSTSPSIIISQQINTVNNTRNNKQTQNHSQPIGSNVPFFSAAQNAVSGLSTVFSTTTDVFSMITFSFTNTNWWVLALFGNIMMLLWGAYLRLRSGRSPGYLFTT